MPNTKRDQTHRMQLKNHPGGKELKDPKNKTFNMSKYISVIRSISLDAFIFLSACNSHSVKQNLNSAGQKAGEAVGEVVHGVSSGVANAFDVSINMSDILKNK